MIVNGVRKRKQANQIVFSKSITIHGAKDIYSHIILLTSAIFALVCGLQLYFSVLLSVRPDDNINMEILLIINSAWNVDSEATNVATDTPVLILNALVAVPAIVEKKVSGK